MQHPYHFLKIAASFVSALVCLCLLPFTVRAQSKFIAFQSLKEKNGLSHNKVYDILRDSEGYIWFATKEGLNQYDGYRFSIFKNNPEDSTSISSNYIQTLFEDSKGKLWIGTYDGGLNVYDRNTGKFTSFKHDPLQPNTISSNNIYTIYEDRKQNLWIGTYGGGLCKFNPEQQNFTVFKTDPENKNSLSSNAVFDIHEDRNGQMWLATFGGGLCAFDPAYQTFTTYLHTSDDKSSIPSNDLFAVCEDKKGSIWIGTYGGGLARFDRKTKTFKSYQKDVDNKNSLYSNYILALASDSLDNLWIATRDAGIYYFDTGKEQFYNFQRDLFHEDVVAVNNLYLDKSGLLWVATEGEGVYRTHSPSIGFDYFVSDGKTIPDFFAKSITAIHEDHKRNLWIGTFGDGVYKFDPGTQRMTNYKSNFFSNNSLAGDFITSITEDKEGMIWIGTSNNGLSRFNPLLGQWQTYQYDAEKKNGINSNAVNTLYVDQSGTLWIGTYGGGLCNFNNAENTFIPYGDEINHAGKSLVGSTVTAIYEDRGFLWVGTKESGLYQVNTETGTYVNYIHDEAKENSIPSNEITGITKDPAGFLWVGTFDKGICRFDTKDNAFYVLNETNGLSSNNVCGVLTGNDGNIWISTVGGISRLKPSSLQLNNFNKDNGLYSEEFVQWSYFKNSSGKLFFGSLNSFVCFDPKNVKEFNYQPPLYTTAFFLYNQQQTFSEPTYQIKSIELEHDDNFFEFEYALLSFDNPEENQYAYMMEGLDKDWKYVNNRRLASYTNLDAGKYTFRVKACDRHGIWHEVANPITIVIHPAWYNTWWFRILSLTVIIGFSFTYYFFKLDAVKKQNILLETLVVNRTSELVEKNKKIKAQKSKIEEKNASLLEAQAIIEETNRELKIINEELESRVEQRTSELKKSNNQLKRANEELDMFVYRSYHDIIGPIARIQGLCKVVALDTQDPVVLKYIHMLDESCQDARRTLHKVLDIYNIRNYEINFSQVDIKGLVEKIKDEFISNPSGQFSSIEVKCSFQTHTVIKTDGALLQNILRNLIENAFKYSQFECNSYIQISVLKKAENFLTIRVEDNGIGILPNIQHKVFTMFFRGTANRSGTGLGLYIAKVATQKLGGQIVYFQKENLTTFEVTIPQSLVQLDELSKAPHTNYLVSD